MKKQKKTKSVYTVGGKTDLKKCVVKKKFKTLRSDDSIDFENGASFNLIRNSKAIFKMQ